MSRQIVIDLFAGCGGLSQGFDSGIYKVGASIEWNPSCIETIRLNASKDHKLFQVDARDFGDYLYGSHGLTALAEKNTVAGVIGGPPCQAYSLAGRIRCPDGMRDDYRNYLFEAYIKVLATINPDFFVFENVVGLLSAAPGGVSVKDRIQEAFFDAGYTIPRIDSNIVFDLASFGGPQHRKRVILFGARASRFKQSSQVVQTFYKNLEQLKREPSCVFDAIGDLAPLRPLPHPTKRKSHESSDQDPLHYCRFHNQRDIEIFRLLAADSKKETPLLRSAEALKQLYTEKTGKTSSVHKYFVLQPDRPSNLIPAHLYKDGLRHIHFDPEQARSITIREAARLQTFPDKFKFSGGQSQIFKMIGNAVPPLMATCIRQAVENALGNIDSNFV